jgi:chromate transporter
LECHLTTRQGLIRKTVPIHTLLMDFDAPKPVSVDPWALGLSAAAAVAIFRFKVGMIRTLAVCCALGIVLHIAGSLR